MQHFGDQRDWIFDRRFGLFLHWGLYALDGWHEQVQWRGRVPLATYAQRQTRFNPVHFDPDAWLDVAEAAGMQYVCLTTKHHDGFCLWDTAQTDYNIMNTPYGKDALRLFADACHRRGMPLGLYYSVVDWHHPAYPNQGRSHELDAPIPGGQPDLTAYLDFLRAQVRELCTHYGEIACFWWDMNVTGLVDESINAMIRELQPGAVINNRGFDAGDFGTPERRSPGEDEARIYEGLVEHCQSIGRESWGYREDEDYYSDVHLQRSLVTALARGGRFLLNVGPMADGRLPEESVAILERLGDWYNRVREAFDGTEPASTLTTNRDVLLTHKGLTLYVFLLAEPTVSRVVLPPISALPERVILLNTGETLPASTEPLPTSIMNASGQLNSPDAVRYLRIHNLPVNRLAGTVMVLRLDFKADTVPR